MYLYSMGKEPTYEFLKQQLTLSAQRECSLLAQVQCQAEQLSRQAEQLSHQAELLKHLSDQLQEQFQTIKSLEESLLKKGKDISSLVGKNHGLTKLLRNTSEKITPPLSAPQEGMMQQGGKKAPLPKERGNNQAKRKVHFNLEEVIEDIWPDDPGFDKDKAKVISVTDSIRYSYIPPRFLKTIYRQHNCVMDEKVYSVSAPRAPFMNSNYDASFVAGLLQLRYIYSLPVERIVKLFTENGFELEKATAHGLISKTSLLLDEFEQVLRRAIHSDPYIRLDETYYNVINEEKNEKGKAVRKVYIWSAMAEGLKLIHFFYEGGSRQKEVFINYLDTAYTGAVHTDGLACYKEIETDTYPHAIRIACVQHAKRKFLDIENDKQAQDIVRTINRLYQIEHEMDPKWVPNKKLAYRNRKAPPILKELKKKLIRLKDDPALLPSTPLAKAVNYLLNELPTVENYLLDSKYTLDNNPIELSQRCISVSRRNSLFFGSHKGAKRGALLYSLACSCRLHNINVFEYFTDILSRMPYLPPKPQYEVLREILPDKWQKKSGK